MMPAPPMAVRQPSTAATPEFAASAAIGLDNSSPEAFIRSVAPYAARVSKATGIPAEALIGMAANETGYGKYAPGNNLFGIKGTGPAGTFSTPTWEDYGNGPVTITDNFRAYHSPAESFLDFANLVTTSPRYKGAVGQSTVDGFVNGLRQGGYMTDPDYTSKIMGITNRYQSVIQQSLKDSGTTARGSVVLSTSASSAASQSVAAGPSAGVVVPDQFHIGLAPEEAMAACGPVAAIAFAQVFGRNPTPAEVMPLAKSSGWTAEGGMNGISNEKRLLDKMGLPSQMEMGANWDHIRASALQHQPVILSTPGHYYVIDGFDAKSGAYHVGQSGKVYRGGSDWLTPEQIAGLSGSPSGALFTAHPLVGGTSGTSGQREVLPPLDLGAGAAAAGQRQVLPPQREVLPPLDLGNTPPPPPIAQPAGSSTMVAASIGEARPIGEASAPSVAAASSAAAAPREPVAAAAADPQVAPAAVAADPIASPNADDRLAAAADPPTLVAAAIPDEPPPTPGPPPTPLTAGPIAATPPSVVPAAAASAAVEPATATASAPVEPATATTAPVEPATPAAATYTMPDSPAAPPPTFTLPDAPATPPPAAASPAPQSGDDPQARSAIPPGIAVGAVAAGTPRPQEPPPPPPRRRPEDELDPP
jgi:hypothetical protein